MHCDQLNNRSPQLTTNRHGPTYEDYASAGTGGCEDELPEILVLRQDDAISILSRQ